jgi:hypothetical protein
MYMQLLESSMAVSLLGMSTTVRGQPQLLLTEPALSALHDPVLLPPGHPGRIIQAWLQHGWSSAEPAGMWSGLRLSGGVQGQTEKCLLRALRVCAHLAETNWRVWLQQEDAANQQQQQEQEEGTDATSGDAASSDPTTAKLDSVSSGGGRTAAAQLAAGEAAAAAHGGACAGSSTGGLPAAAIAAGSSAVAAARGLQGLPAPLVFSEWIVAVNHSEHNPDVLYSTFQQQQQLEGARPLVLGAATAALMPVLAARMSLLLCCLVADLAVLQTFEAAGRMPNFLRGESLTPALLLLSIGVTKQMLELAVDLAKAQHNRESAAAAGSSPGDSPGGGAAELASTQQDGKQQPHQHWLIPGLRAALKAVNALVPPSSSSGGGAKPKGKSSSGSSSMQLTQFSEAVLALAGPLGMKLVQISTQPGEAGGVDKEFTGLASKNMAQSAQNKVLASTVITVSQVSKYSPYTLA